MAYLSFMDNPAHVPQAVGQQFALNARLFRDCLEGVTDEQARQKPVQHLNTLLWLAGHLTTVRSFVLVKLGQEPLMEPWLLVFNRGSSGEPDENWPKLQQVLTAFDLSQTRLDEAFSNPELDWNGAPPWELPAPLPHTLLGFATFMAQHEMYHLGQMSTARQAVGLGGLKLRTDPKASGKPAH